MSMQVKKVAPVAIITVALAVGYLHARVAVRRPEVYLWR